jgi:hypothetical protein
MIATIAIICCMNSKHRKTLAAIFAIPTKATIRFIDIEALLVALGATVSEGNGSRVLFLLHDEEWHAHRPHPGKEAKKYQIEGVRELLHRLEIQP